MCYRRSGQDFRGRRIFPQSSCRYRLESLARKSASRMATVHLTRPGRKALSYYEVRTVHSHCDVDYSLFYFSGSFLCMNMDPSPFFLCLRSLRPLAIPSDVPVGRYLSDVPLALLGFGRDGVRILAQPRRHAAPLFLRMQRCTGYHTPCSVQDSLACLVLPWLPRHGFVETKQGGCRAAGETV